MKGIVLLLAYLFFSSATESSEQIVDMIIKEGRKQLAACSQRAEAAFADNRCYRCGVCCKEKPCRFGQWNADHSQCAYLMSDMEMSTYTTYRCAKYDDIVIQERGKPLPIFGNGCSNPVYNELRERIRREMQNNLPRV